MKKILLLISLITVLSSCGGGGGGGSSSSQTGSATPVPTPNQPNNNNQTQNPNLPNNSQTQNNPSQSGLNNQPGTNNNNSSPSQVPENKTFTGRGVEVAVLDSDFLSSDLTTNQLYHKTSGLNEVINKEFGDRFVQESRADRTYLSKDEHGILVASILGGKSGKGATGARIHGVTVGEGSGFYIDVEKYKELQRNAYISKKT